VATHPSAFGCTRAGGAARAIARPDTGKVITTNAAARTTKVTIAAFSVAIDEARMPHARTCRRAVDHPACVGVVQG
jgi:hypothetical protein